MMVLITYDVNTETTEGARRLRRVAKICKNHGQRVQYSVFECVVDSAQYVALKGKLIAEINPECDSLRFYSLGNNWRSRTEHIGAKPAYDPEGPLIL